MESEHSSFRIFFLARTELSGELSQAKHEAVSLHPHLTELRSSCLTSPGFTEVAQVNLYLVILLPQDPEEPGLQACTTKIILIWSHSMLPKIRESPWLRPNTDPFTPSSPWSSFSCPCGDFLWLLSFLLPAPAVSFWMATSSLS